jgi:hypothetical protein
VDRMRDRLEQGSGFTANRTWQAGGRLRLSGTAFAGAKVRLRRKRRRPRSTTTRGRRAAGAGRGRMCARPGRGRRAAQDAEPLAAGAQRGVVAREQAAAGPGPMTWRTAGGTRRGASVRSPLCRVADLRRVELLEQARTGAARHEQQGRVADEAGEQVAAAQDVVLVAVLVAADADAAEQVEQARVQVGLARGLGHAHRGDRGRHRRRAAHADPEEQDEQQRTRVRRAATVKSVGEARRFVKLRKRQAIHALAWHIWAPGHWPLTRGRASGGGRASVSRKTAEGPDLEGTGPSYLSGRRDSNSRHQPWQGCALPTELLPHSGEAEGTRGPEPSQAGDSRRVRGRALGA